MPQNRKGMVEKCRKQLPNVPKETPGQTLDQNQHTDGQHESCDPGRGSERCGAGTQVLSVGSVIPVDEEQGVALVQYVGSIRAAGDILVLAVFGEYEAGNLFM